MIVAMFRTYLKPQANLDDLGVLHQKNACHCHQHAGLYFRQDVYR